MGDAQRSFSVQCQAYLRLERIQIDRQTEASDTELPSNAAQAPAHTVKHAHRSCFTASTILIFRLHSNQCVRVIIPRRHWALLHVRVGLPDKVSMLFNVDHAD